MSFTESRVYIYLRAGRLRNRDGNVCKDGRGGRTLLPSTRVIRTRNVNANNTDV